MSLSRIPKGTLTKIWKLCYKFLWLGILEKYAFPWVKWSKIAMRMGWWGLKQLPFFSQALATKASWRMISSQNLWTSVVYKKYIFPLSLEDWIWNSNKNRPNTSIIWRAIVNSFPLIENSLAWKVEVGTGL